MLLVTKEGCIVDCNSIFAHLALGYAREELVGKVENTIQPKTLNCTQSNYFFSIGTQLHFA